MIVHLLAIEIYSPATTEWLFSLLFEICAFDFFETEIIYDSLFGFDNVPINDQLDAIGYGSQFIIFNLGTISLVIFMQVVVRIIITLLAKLTPKNSKV